MFKASSASPSSIIQTLRKKVESLPKKISIAPEDHALAPFSQPPKNLTNFTDDEDVWEMWDRKLNVLLPHNVEELKLLVVRGQYGLIGLVRFLEHLVHDCDVDEGLLEGKVGRLIETIDRFVYFTRINLLDAFLCSVVMQAPNSSLSSKLPAAPVSSASASSSANDLLPSISTKANTARKGNGRGSWKPSNAVSPK